MFRPQPFAPIPYTITQGTTVTLQDALSAIPEFEGDPSSFGEFSDGCEEAKNMVDPNMEANLTKLIRNKLRGPAKNSIQGRQFHSVNELIRFLQNLFAPMESLAQLQGKLGRLMQEKYEPVVVYGNRARQLMISIFNAYARNGGSQRSFKIDTEQETIRCFRRGLKYGLKINPSRCLNLDDAISEAIEAEKEKQARDELHGNTSTSQWPRGPTNNPRNRNFNRYHDNPRVNVMQEERNCKFCGKIGHTEDYCWAKNGYPKPIICAHCEKRGHTIQDCRKKKWEEKMRRERDQQNQTGNGYRPSASGARTEEKAAHCASIGNPSTGVTIYTI